MPRSKKPGLSIKLNLLKPQSNPAKIPVKFISWLFSSGRYIFIIVNGLVLIAFIARFKLDADLASTKETIKTRSPDWQDLLKRIADQTPVSITITSINIEKNAGKNVIRLSGQTRISSDVN